MPVLVKYCDVEVRDGDKVVRKLNTGEWLVVIMRSNGWLLLDDQSGWIKEDDVVERNQAAKFFTEEIAKQPDKGCRYYGRARAYDTLNRSEQAKKDYLAAVRLSPGYASYANVRARIGIVSERGSYYRYYGDPPATGQPWSSAVAENDRSGRSMTPEERGRDPRRLLDEANARRANGGGTPASSGEISVNRALPTGGGDALTLARQYLDMLRREERSLRNGFDDVDVDRREQLQDWIRRVEGAISAASSGSASALAKLERTLQNAALELRIRIPRRNPNTGDHGG
jgi:tetratricopeptide (TPR) repeat protein